MASPPIREYHVSYGIGGAGNMRRASDRQTAVEELTRLASNTSSKLSSTGEPLYNVNTGASRSSGAAYDCTTAADSEKGFASSPPKEEVMDDAGKKRRSSILAGWKGAFGRKGSSSNV